MLKSAIFRCACVFFLFIVSFFLAFIFEKMLCYLAELFEFKQDALIAEA